MEALGLLLPSELSYLEIGVAAGETFTGVNAARRVGVDPAPAEFEVPQGGTLHRIPSREYFLGPVAQQDGPFDVVFVDGLHLWEEALEDTLSSFELLAAGGFVIVDDTYPFGRWEGERAESYAEAVANARRNGVEITPWMGDVWRTALLLTTVAPPELEWVTIPITAKRYHTVFWWSDNAIAGRSLRPAITESAVSETISTPIEVVGDYTWAGMADWYQPQSFDAFSQRIQRGLRATK